MEEERKRLHDAFERGDDLRVVGLRRLLALYEIPHSAKLRKHQLVQLCKDEIPPRPEISENIGKASKRRPRRKRGGVRERRKEDSGITSSEDDSKADYEEEAIVTPKIYKHSDTATPKTAIKDESTPQLSAPDPNVSTVKAESESPHPFLSHDNVFQSKKRTHASDDRRRSLKRQRLDSTSTSPTIGTHGDNDISGTGSTSTSSRINISLDIDPNLLAANSTSLADGVEKPGSGTSECSFTPKSHHASSIGDRSITPVSPSYSGDVSEVDTPSPKRQSQPLTLKGPTGNINDVNVLFPNGNGSSSQEGKNGAAKNYVHSPDLSLNDSAALTHLLSEIEGEKSRLELESEKCTDELNSSIRLQFVRRQVAKFLVGFISFSVILKCFLVYLKERTLVGFCGYEIRQRWINPNNFPPQLANIINVVNQWHLQCVPCPANAQCSVNSVLSCVADYTVSRPVLWSLGGIIPTYNECVLDSAKLKKINSIIRLVFLVLAKRNANFHCGDGTDEEVGLTWDQIVEFASDKLNIDPNDDHYEYYWTKVHATLVGQPDLTFNSNGIIRSHSLSQLSISCRLKRSVLSLVYRLRYYLASVAILVLLFSVIFYKINRWQRKKESIRDLTQKVLSKLQQQSKQFKLKHADRKFLGKIQLRDYYLPQLRMSKADRLAIWDAVVARVEENSNVKVTNEEVDGDIMRVWQWTLDVI